MFVWLLQNYKAALAVFTALITSVAIPLWFFAVGVIAKIDTSAAMAQIHDQKIIKLEEAFYRSDERGKRIEKILERLEDREYSELKQARQSRQAHP